MEQEASGLAIDWRLLLLQAGNFLFLLGILTWLVWKPLVRMIDERRKTIAEGLEAADASKKAAAATEIERAKLLNQAKSDAAKILKEARDESKAERDEAIKNAKAERERILKATEASSKLEKAKLEAEVKAQSAELLTTALTSVLGGRIDDAKRWQPELEKISKDLS